jgi:thiamine-phosphate pyrophosphorylase
MVITAPGEVSEEADSIMQLIEAGARIHVRKPEMNEPLLAKWIQQFPKEVYHQFHLHAFPELANKMGLRGIHLKDGQKLPTHIQWNGVLSKACHRLADVHQETTSDVDYLFLSSVFDSISKKGYKATFDLTELAQLLKNDNRKTEVMALGGVELENIQQVKQLGFDGVALLGAIWQRNTTTERLQYFKKVKAYAG